MPHLVFSPAPGRLLHRHVAGCQSRWDCALQQQLSRVDENCSAHLKAFILLHQLLLGEQVLGLDILQTGRPFFTLSNTKTMQRWSGEYCHHLGRQSRVDHQIKTHKKRNRDKALALYSLIIAMSNHEKEHRRRHRKKKKSCVKSNPKLIFSAFLC